MSRDSSPQVRAEDVMNQLGHELNAATEAIEVIVSQAIAEETNRCLRWLGICSTTREAVDHIEDYDEPPPEAA